MPTPHPQLTDEQIEALGQELDELRNRLIGRPRRARRRLHPPDDQEPAGSRDPRPRAAGGRISSARVGRRHGRPVAVEDPRQHGDRPQRDARPVRLDEGSGAGLQAVRVGHRVPGRPVALLAQLHAPHPHQRARQGPRHRLRRPADVRGSAVAPARPRQPDLRDAADAAVPVGRRRARPRGRADRGRRDRHGATSARSCRAIWRKGRRQVLKDYVVFPRWRARARRSC